MIDGLALGETTPGPLIMVVAFVGFIGASTQEVFGLDLPLLAGITGAGVATFFTFLPSFLFIVCGAPRRPKVHRPAHWYHRRGGGGHGLPGGILRRHALWPAGTDAAPFAGGFQ